MATKHDVLTAHLQTWLDAKKDRKRRAEVTRLICQSIQIHPKSVPRAFKRLQLRGKDVHVRSGRPTVYTSDVIAALLDIWEAGDRCCGELLHPMIREYVEIFRRDHEWNHVESATTKLLQMSERTVKRHVLALQKKYGTRRGISATKSSSLKAIIPIFKGPWKDVPPGNGQIDTVAHCGDSLLGDFVFTVNYTDAATYWMIPRAQWNKGQEATQRSLATIETKLPFAILGLHPDTGSEFINYHLKRWCDEKGIHLTRSEPGKKNDNMYVEERNGHVVRRYLGYLRYDAPEVVPAINELYETLELYLNHFKAVRRQVSKDRVGSKYVRKYEPRAKTPYTRVLEHATIAEAVKNRLREKHAGLNPMHLKQRIDTLILNIYKLQSAAREREVAKSESR
jgi:hypothetical protein